MMCFSSQICSSFYTFSLGDVTVLWFANVALLNGSSCHVISTQCLLCVSRKDNTKGKALYTDIGVLMFDVTLLRKKHVKMYLN